MAPTNPSASFFATQKRSACDRCRKQKLRCPVRVDDTQHCDRCIRAGVPCVTGYTQPLGRSCHDVLRRRSSISKTARAGGIRYQPTDPSPPGSSGSQSTAETRSGTSLDPSPRASYFGRLLPKDIDDLHSLANHHFDLDDLASSYVESEALLSLPQPIDLDYHMDIGDEPKDFRKESEALSWAQCDLRLSQLSVDLCKQMEVCKKAEQHPHERDQPVADKTSPVSTNRQADPNAFGNALCSTSEFLTIFQCNIRRSDMAGQGSSFPSPSFTCILNLLACYARIIAIFDSLLLDLYDQLKKGPASTSQSATSRDPQTLPGLQLGGFVVQQGTLQTKILVQTIEHQFETIEKTLGLPLELRVSDQASLSSVLNCFGAMDQAAGAENRTHFAASLASLKEAIVNVKRILDT
ncbi:hypothetical protein K456DRAFT_32914 [Colletotrichum gloeosporioides 23]|nr:hypothetical protein K456DRAFT_32914 [Colletotrichum gloeosporioides 23]